MMLHIFIKYTTTKSGHDCTVDLLKFVRDHIGLIRGTGNKIVIHKITDSMLHDKSITTDLAKKGVSSLPSLVSTTGMVVVGNSAIKRFILSLQHKPPPQQREEREEEYYDEGPVYTEEDRRHISSRDMGPESWGDDEGFDSNDKLMERYRRTLKRTPAGMPERQPKPGMERPPEDISEKMNVGNNDKKITDSVDKSLQNLEDHQDNDLLQKLMDNLGDDTSY